MILFDLIPIIQTFLAVGYATRAVQLLLILYGILQLALWMLSIEFMNYSTEGTISATVGRRYAPVVYMMIFSIIAYSFFTGALISSSYIVLELNHVHYVYYLAVLKVLCPVVFSFILIFPQNISVTADQLGMQPLNWYQREAAENQDAQAVENQVVDQQFKYNLLLYSFVCCDQKVLPFCPISFTNFMHMIIVVAGLIFGYWNMVYYCTQNWGSSKPVQTFAIVCFFISVVFMGVFVLCRFVYIPFAPGNWRKSWDPYFNKASLAAEIIGLVNLYGAIAITAILDVGVLQNA